MLLLQMDSNPVPICWRFPESCCARFPAAVYYWKPRYPNWEMVLTIIVTTQNSWNWLGERISSFKLARCHFHLLLPERVGTLLLPVAHKCGPQFCWRITIRLEVNPPWRRGAALYCLRWKWLNRETQNFLGQEWLEKISEQSIKELILQRSLLPELEYLSRSLLSIRAESGSVDHTKK